MRLFAYRLAVKLGVCNVDKMLDEITYPQFLEWMTYAELEPFDEIRADYRSAQITAEIGNLFRRNKIPISDYLLKFNKSVKRTQTWQDQKAMAWVIARMLATPTPERKH
jgi:hypothetical protein